MPFTGIMDPEQLAVLTKVLDDHCAERGIERSSPDGLDAGHVILSLFGNGAQTVEELKAALDAALARDPSQSL
jgi:hypothetical protein